MKFYIDKIKKSSLEDKTYFVWGIYIFICFLNAVGIIFINDKCQTILKLVRYICYIVFAIKFFDDWRKGEKITLSIICMFIVSIAIAVIAKNRSIFFMTLVLVGLRKMDFDKLIKIALWIFMISFAIVISLALLGIIPNWEFSRGAEPRYALGFIYATDAIGMYLIIILMCLYTKKNTLTNKELLLLQLINIFMYSYTDGRMSFILISLVLFLQFISKYNFAKKIFYKDVVQKTLKMICNILPIILFLGLHFLIFMYANNSSVSKKIDTLLSSRIRYTYQAYRNNNIGLFGNDIDWNGWGAYGYTDEEIDENFKYNFVDSSYASIVFDYGLIFSCIVILGYRRILITNYEKENYWLVFTIIFILLWSFIEQHIINLSKNVFVIAFIPLFEMGEIKKLEYKNFEKLFKKIDN